MKNKTAIFLSQHWSLLSILAAMILSGLYLVFYTFISLWWTPSQLDYWFMFPLFLYSGTYWTAILAAFLFALCGMLLVLRFNKTAQISKKGHLVIGWSILSGCVLLAMIGFLFTSNGVVHLSSIDHKQHTMHLAYKNNNESGDFYYLIDCNRRTFQCKMVARFFPHYSYWNIDNLKLARLSISENNIVTVVGYDGQAIYEYSLPSE